MSNIGIFAILLVIMIAAPLLAVHWNRREAPIPRDDENGKRTYFPAPVFKACYEKDEALYESLGTVTISEFWREWQKAYPEDFPEGGMTSAWDTTAIKPRHVH